MDAQKAMMINMNRGLVVIVRDDNHVFHVDSIHHHANNNTNTFTVYQIGTHISYYHNHTNTERSTRPQTTALSKEPNNTLIPSHPMSSMINAP